MKPKAKKLVLDLLLAARGEPVSARNIVYACSLFGISENNARVSMARLSGEGLIVSATRGQYLLSEQAATLGEEVNAWQTAEQKLREWQGAVIAVHTAGLGRSNRTALRHRERALQMLGFRQLDGALFLRPDNIEQDVHAVRKRLYRLGLEQKAPVFLAKEFAAPQQKQIMRLWDSKALNRSYREQTRTLQRWLDRHHELPADTAAKEAFLLGGAAIRQIVFDPLLPDQMIDAELRQALFRITREFDSTGQQIWRRLFDSLP